MADLQDPRSWTDAELDEAWVLLETHLPAGNATRIVATEVSRRAELRLVRGEYGQHDAAWYAPRPLDTSDPCIALGGERDRIPVWCDHLRGDHDEDGCRLCGCSAYRTDGAPD